MDAGQAPDGGPWRGGGLWRREESWGERAGGNQVEAGGAMRLLDSETTAAISIPGDGKTGIVEINQTK